MLASRSYIYFLKFSFYFVGEMDFSNNTKNYIIFVQKNIKNFRD
jgi:hypothetical protein